MVSDILSITKEVIDLFSKHELSRMQSVFVLEACKLAMSEEITKEIIREDRRSFDSYAGIA